MEKSLFILTQLIYLKFFNTNGINIKYYLIQRIRIMLVKGINKNCLTSFFYNSGKTLILVQ